jgi:hypothetical protein
VTRDGATFPDIEPEIDQLLHPSRFYARPTDVVVDQLLTVDERRAILSSWAYDVLRGGVQPGSAATTSRESACHLRRDHGCPHAA